MSRWAYTGLIWGANAIAAAALCANLQHKFGRVTVLGREAGQDMIKQVDVATWTGGLSGSR